MAKVDKGETVTLQELMVSSLAQTDAVAKLLIEKGAPFYSAEYLTVDRPLLETLWLNTKSVILKGSRLKKVKFKLTLGIYLE